MKNYTPEQTQEIVNAYVANPTSETVAFLAAEYEKPVKSIIGKLSAEKVYVKQVYATKTGEPVVTKPELVAAVTNLLGLDHEALAGLEKAPKAVLALLVKAVS